MTRKGCKNKVNKKIIVKCDAPGCPKDVEVSPCHMYKKHHFCDMNCYAVWLSEDGPSKNKDVAEKISKALKGKSYETLEAEKTASMHSCEWCETLTSNPKFCSHKCAGDAREGIPRVKINRTHPCECCKKPTDNPRFCKKRCATNALRKGVPRTDAVKEKISKSVLENLEEHPELRQFLSDKQKGIPSWNKGLTKETDERLAKAGESISVARNTYSPMWNKGKTKETDDRVRKNAENISKALMGHETSDETRRKIGLGNTGKVISEEQREAVSKFMKENNPMDREDVRQRQKEACQDPVRNAKISYGVKEAWKDPEYREIQTDNRTGKNNGMFGRPAAKGSGIGKGGFYLQRNGVQIWLRSSYEIRMAKLLDDLLIPWEYETSFDIGGVDTYYPDFYCVEYNLYLETKGFWRPSDKKKMLAFYTLYPNENVRIVMIDDLEELEYKFENGITIDIQNVGTSLEEQILVW